MSKVGIVIPHYNAGKYLEAAILSCLKDVSAEKTVYVVDDCSDLWHLGKCFDLSVDIKNIKVKMLSKNGGASRARNIGAELAIKDGCDILIFHDADDIFGDFPINERIKHFSDKNVSVVYGDYWNGDENGNKISYEKKPSFDMKELFYNNYISCLSCVRAKDFISVGGFDEHLTFGEDHDLWLRILARGKLAVHVSKPFFTYRGNPDSQTRKIDWELYRLDMEIIKAKADVFNGKEEAKHLMLKYNQKINYVLRKGK